MTPAAHGAVTASRVFAAALALPFLLLGAADASANTVIQAVPAKPTGLTEAQGVAPRLADPGERDRRRPAAPDVVHDEANRPPGRRVRLPAGAERAEARVHA